MTMIVLAPTRGRATQAAQMAASFRDTKTLPGTMLVLVVDRDDETLHEYGALDPDDAVLMVVTGGSLTAATNEAAPRIWDGATILGHVGDDHRFRTPGWDARITKTLIRPGVAYGNDLHRGRDMASAWFVTASIVRELGWLALPGTRHLCIDRAWMTLGRTMGALTYLPDLVIEHLHPRAGKAEWDDGYRRANSAEGKHHDRGVYEAWVADGLQADVARLRVTA